MTRINCIPVQELTDKHLLAEYREMSRISNAAYSHPEIPNNYRLGKGHVIFFYDKGEYLRKRYEEQIVPEMQKRGFRTNYTIYRKHPDGLNNDWTPSDIDMQINRERINERLQQMRQRNGLLSY